MSRASLLKKTLLAICFSIGLLGLGTLVVIESRYFAEGTYYGRHTNQLRPGASVYINEACIDAFASSSLKAAGHKDDFRTVLDTTKETRGVVKIDPAWDEDSCYPERPITVAITEGRDKGEVFGVPRNCLHR